MPSPKQRTLKLTEPVEWAGQEYTHLTFRKLKGKHLVEIGTAGDNPIEQSFALAAASAGVDVGVIHEMDLEDIMAMQEVLGDFFPKGLLGKQPDAPDSSPST